MKKSRGKKSNGWVRNKFKCIMGCSKSNGSFLGIPSFRTQIMQTNNIKWILWWWFSLMYSNSSHCKSPTQTERKSDSLIVCRKYSFGRSDDDGQLNNIPICKLVPNKDCGLKWTPLHIIQWWNHILQVIWSCLWEHSMVNFSRLFYRQILCITS